MGIYDKTPYEIISKFQSSIKSKLIYVILIIPMSIILMTSMYTYSSISDCKKHYNAIIEHYKLCRGFVLTATIAETYKRARLQTNYIKENIVDDLAGAYKNNIEEMKNDYYAKDLNSKFYQILSKNISNRYLNINNSNNRVFIANRNGVLIDNSLEYYSNSFLSWEDYIKGSSNKEIIKATLNNIVLQKTESSLFWTDQKVNDSLINSLNNEAGSIEHTIKSIVLNNDLQEIEKLSIASISYIFDTKDIFNVPDIQVGQFMNNDKLYVIQVFNIGDMMDTTYKVRSTMDLFKNMINEAEQQKRDTVEKYVLYMIGLLILELITFIGIWYLVELYNRYEHEERKLN